jgi:hypothetical protein
MIKHASQIARGSGISGRVLAYPASMKPEVHENNNNAI